MHITRRLNRLQRAIGPLERTVALLLWALVLGAPLPLGGLDAFALNTVGLGAGALLIRQLTRNDGRQQTVRRMR